MPVRFARRSASCCTPTTGSRRRAIPTGCCAEPPTVRASRSTSRPPRWRRWQAASTACSAACSRSPTVPWPTASWDRLKACRNHGCRWAFYDYRETGRPAGARCSCAATARRPARIGAGTARPRSRLRAGTRPTTHCQSVAAATDLAGAAHQARSPLEVVLAHAEREPDFERPKAPGGFEPPLTDNSRPANELTELAGLRRCELPADLQRVVDRLPLSSAAGEHAPDKLKEPSTGLEPLSAESVLPEPLRRKLDELKARNPDRSRRDSG